MVFHYQKQVVLKVLQKTIILACTPYWYKFYSNKEQPEHSLFKLFTHKRNSNPYERFHIQHVWIFLITDINTCKILHSSLQIESRHGITCIIIPTIHMYTQIPNLILWVQYFYDIGTVLQALQSYTILRSQP